MCVASGGMHSEGLWKFGGGVFTGFRFTSLNCDRTFGLALVVQGGL